MAENREEPTVIARSCPAPGVLVGGYAARPTRLAMIVVNSPGSTGFET